MIELNKMISIKAETYELMSRLGNQERRVHAAHELGIMEGSEHKFIADEGLVHEGPYQVEEF